MKPEAPIGIFDSGIGGLTVLKQLRALMPNERLIYFGDTARIPYGTKSRKLIQRYALEDAQFLLQHNVKMIVVACNTASALAIDVLTDNLSIPVSGVVRPGSVAAFKKANGQEIAVLGTSATINSNAYNLAIQDAGYTKTVHTQACPLLVPLVEEGWLDGNITELILWKYLQDIDFKNIGALVLGCTHYPLLAGAIQSIVGNSVQLIDSGYETAYFVKKKLETLQMLNLSQKQEADTFYVSDIPQKFQEIGSRFLGAPLQKVVQINFEKFLLENSLQITHLLQGL